jgi:hypothetical protein
MKFTFSSPIKAAVTGLAMIFMQFGVNLIMAIGGQAFFATLVWVTGFVIVPAAAFLLLKLLKADKPLMTAILAAVAITLLQNSMAFYFTSYMPEVLLYAVIGGTYAVIFWAANLLAQRLRFLKKV